MYLWWAHLYGPPTHSETRSMYKVQAYFGAPVFIKSIRMCALAKELRVGTLLIQSGKAAHSRTSRESVGRPSPRRNIFVTRSERNIEISLNLSSCWFWRVWMKSVLSLIYRHSASLGRAFNILFTARWQSQKTVAHVVWWHCLSMLENTNLPQGWTSISHWNCYTFIPCMDTTNHKWDFLQVNKVSQKRNKNIFEERSYVLNCNI